MKDTVRRSSEGSISVMRGVPDCGLLMHRHSPDLQPSVQDIAMSRCLEDFIHHVQIQLIQEALSFIVFTVRLTIRGNEKHLR